MNKDYEGIDKKKTMNIQQCKEYMQKICRCQKYKAY